MTESIDFEKLDKKYSGAYTMHIPALDGYSSTGEIAKECGRDFDEFANAVARRAEEACSPDIIISDDSVPDLSGPSKIR